MKSSSAIGIAFLVIAAGLAVYAPFVLKAGENPSQANEPAPFATQAAAMVAPSASVPDWDTQQPRQEAMPKRHHPIHRKLIAHHAMHKPHPAPTHAPEVADEAPEAPLPAPTFMQSAPEPEAHTQVMTPPEHHKVEVIEDYHPPVRVVRHQRPKPHPHPVMEMPATPSAVDLTRQRQLERKALIDAAMRTARGTVENTVPNVAILSADADDHGTYISVVVVEQRASGTVIENFVFTPGPSALGLAQRRVLSQNTSDPFITH